MIAYGENIQVFCGNSNPQFAQTICKELGVPMGKAIVTHFADGEASVTLEETVRGADVFLIQSTCKPVNDNLMELLVMIDACRRASASPPSSPTSATPVRIARPSPVTPFPPSWWPTCSPPPVLTAF